MRLLLALLLLSCVGCASAARVSLEPLSHVGGNSQRADPSKPGWNWSKEKASLAYSEQQLPDYEVELVSPREPVTRINIRRTQDHAIIYSIMHGSEHTVFTRSQDILYIAEYDPISTGCEVVAVDLKSGDQLWRTKLQGIGPTVHSIYSNLVNIENDGRVVIVAGNEMNGCYIERLDMQTGAMLTNKRFAPDTRSWSGY